jgi:hypothetical protein
MELFPQGVSEESWCGVNGNSILIPAHSAVKMTGKGHPQDFQVVEWTILRTAQTRLRCRREYLLVIKRGNL